MLEEVEGKVNREQLVEFAALATNQSDHDAVLYAYEAALKAARWAPVLKEEQGHQADMLRQIVGRPF
jgi:hypothetical protein